MRSLSAFIIGASILAVSATSSQAGFLLNCKLMERGSDLYEWLCRETNNSYLLAENCAERKVCVIKKQNFKGAYTSFETTLDGVVSEAAGAVNETAGETGSETGLVVGDATQGALAPKGSPIQ